MKFYESRKWKRKRENILRRDGYQCQESKRYGKYAEATTVHHIYPLEEYPELAFVDWNLISMSAAQHDRMHDRTTGKITEAGLHWQRKRKTEFNVWNKKHPPSLLRIKNVSGESGERTLSNSAAF